jgi:hypothetical protein
VEEVLVHINPWYDEDSNLVAEKTELGAGYSF